MSGTLGQVVAQANRTEMERRFEFAALPHGWGAVLALLALVVVCWFVIWMYRHEGRRGASARLRTLLSLIRCAVLMALAAVWLQPVLATYLHRWIDSYCIVLVDDSSSMDLRDQYRLEEEASRVKTVMGEEQTFPVRRADVIGHLLRRNHQALLRGLTERNRVKVYAFSDAPKLMATLRGSREQGASDSALAPAEANGETSGSHVAATGADPLLAGFSAQGPGTNPSRALRRSVESLGGAPLAGVVLLSDGGFNQGDPVEVLARYVGERKIPIHVVGVGDAAPPQNVRVTEVVAPENVFKQDPFAVTAYVTTQGMNGETILVGLYESEPGATAGPPVETRPVTVARDGPLDPVVFDRRRENLGPAAFRIAVPIGPYESVTDDNVKQVVVNVIDDKMRVLLISGSPSWEYRYLSRLLMRDATFDVSCWLQSAGLNAVRVGNTIIDHLPSTPEELFAYDAVILLDPDSSEFGPGWARSLETLVTEYGGGVLFAASRKYTPQFMRDPAVDRIVRLLPVSLDPEADLILNKIGHYQTRPWPIEIAPESAGHPIVRPPEHTASARSYWSDVPGVYWHYPVLRETPVATVLMRHSNPQHRNSYGGHVLAATQFIGAGRSAFLAFDGTWRWRRQGEAAFNAFWVQMLRYLVEGKLLGAKKRATILTEGTTFQLGSAVDVMARLYDARFEPLQLDSVPAAYRVGAARQTFELRRSPDEPGWYEGRFTPNQTGTYEISLALSNGGAVAKVAVSHQIEVVRPNIEILNPRMDREALQLLADRSPGGAYYEIDQADRIPEVIPDRSESTTVRSRPIPLWDNKWTLMLLVGLLAIEWGVRKWVRLL